MSDTKEEKVLNLLSSIKEIDEEIYNGMTFSPSTSTQDTQNKICVRWGTDPQTGRRLCLKWE